VDLIKFIGLICWLEVMARITGRKDHGPYLVGFTAAEQETDFERALYAVLGPGPED
jgi:hypothetical protein